MSTEFIIGTIIGLIGIIPVIIQIVKWVKKPKLSELMKKLVDNSLSTNAHRKILKYANLPCATCTDVVRRVCTFPAP